MSALSEWRRIAASKVDRLVRRDEIIQAPCGRIFLPTRSEPDWHWDGAFHLTWVEPTNNPEIFRGGGAPVG